MMGIIKFLQRSIYVLRLVTITFFMWKKSEWVKFWFTKKYNIAQIGSLKFWVRGNHITTKVSDLSMLFEVIYFKDYGLCKIEPNDIIVDIGAHIGGFSIYASNIAKNGKIFSFEPFPSSFEYLKNNIILNKKSNIRVYNYAVGSNIKDGFLYVNESNLAENSLIKKASRKIPIKTTTLTNIFKENNINHCNILKIDCEGAEYEILFSSKKLLKKIDQIIMEYHVPKYFGIPREYSPERLVQYLKQNNFKVIMKKNRYYQGIIYAKK